MGQIASLSELGSLFRRHGRLILSLTAIGMIAVAGFTQIRGPLFEATAVLEIEPSSIAPGPAPGAIAAAQLRSIEQRLTTRSALLDLIARHDLFADLPALSDARRVALLRDSISFHPISGADGFMPRPPPDVQALAITARLANAEQAARVANDLAQAILDRGTEALMQRAREIQRFYAEEEARIWNDIVALNAEIAGFRASNADALPASRAAKQADLAAIETDLRALAQSRLSLAAERDALAARTDLRTTGQRQLEALTTQITALSKQEQALESRRADLRAALARAPAVDLALGAYDRRLGLLQGQHATVSQHLAEAQTQQRLADLHQAERFAMLERAATPDAPVGSGGPGQMLLAALVSLALALALALVLDRARPVLRTSAQMARQTGRVPLVVIPDLSR